MRSLILLFTFLFISCALDDGKLSGNLYEYDAERTGMVRIPAKDQFVLLGTNDSTAPLNDRPSMKVKFTYSFSISKNEVTRKEYIELMGENRVPFKIAVTFHRQMSLIMMPFFLLMQSL